ncbi:M14-type cytosolic carboxypeptidase [Paraburkholderia bonniea]|uniref:M14-type cytosolic carboxypeptidase n=1 Tax=Paraburkholderia bonniea TaxID=2152891 RepID=UPI001291E34A|nr:M14-type cytosolic carboxypeptidase [Paraburkholderia bonniea]
MTPAYKTLWRSVFYSLLITFLVACGSTINNSQSVHFSADFESGSLPLVKQLDQQGLSYELALRNDNNDATLPDSFRTWWYVRADNVPVQKNLQLVFTRLGFPNYFVPVYSYDNKTWQYFDEKDVSLAPGCDITLPETCRLTISKTFASPTVWIARTFPYTTQDLASFIASVSASPYFQTEMIGLSPGLAKPLQLITLADNTVVTPRQTIWIHARTHAAETGPSYLLEGLIQAVLSNNALGQALRQHYIFKIVPMHNVDGIVLGNYRTNAASINLEPEWLFDEGNVYLNDAAPLENRLINRMAMAPAMLNQDAPVVLALNLHSSNSDPDTGAFFFPHFGSDPARYSAQQINLWNKQISFIKALAVSYGGKIERPPVDGGAGFLQSAFPETWWWAQRADAVTAITLETTYGRAGFNHWVTQSDLRELGTAVANAIGGMGAAWSQTGVQAGVQATAQAGTLQAEPAADDMSMFRLPFKPEIYKPAE